MVTSDQNNLRRKFIILIVLFAMTSVGVFRASGQITPVTQNPCDPRSTANGGVCPVGCTFAPTLEKGCNCFDSIDNDGDGKIDAADPKCGSYFGLSFVGTGSSNCSIVPPPGLSPFVGIGAPATSQQNTADTQSKVAVGDVTGDGVPESVVTSKWNNEVRVINANGTVNASFNLSGQKGIFTGFTDVDGKTAVPDRLLLEMEVLIADIKRSATLNPDGKGEIFAIVSSRGGNPKTPPNGFYLLALTWTKPDPNGLQLLYNPIPIGTNRPGIFGIADMDGDGYAEIYLRDRIYAAETGKLLASEGGKTHLNTSLWDVDVTSAPAAVTVTGDNKMELICGTKVYSIPSLTNRTPASPAPLVLVKDMNVDFPATKCFVKLMNDPVEYGLDTHSSTSVADIDGDGFIDVVISGALNSSVGRTGVFYWNIQKNTVAYKLTPNSAELGLAAADPNYINYSTGWIWGTGRVNIGDANGDGRSDLSFIAGNQLFSLTTDAAGTGLVTLWTQNLINTATGTIGYRSINDSRSGVLTVTIYDFNNDGKPEMVYRDSQSLNVIDGATGTTLLWSVICQSHTYTEGPVIADVNGDGATDICVTCNTSNSFNIDADIQQQALGQVRLYFTNGNTWLPTRKVWNQPGYFVVNINDNLTLPFPQLDQNIVFSNAPCPNGLPGPQRPLNVFLNQVPFMNANGCPVFPAPDLSFIGQDPATADPTAPGYFPAVIITPPICGNLNIGAVFNLGNTGDLPITDNVPVSFFNGDPRLAGATRLYNTTIPITNLQIGDTLTTAPIVFNGPGTTFDLYIALYNDGSVLPIAASGQTTKECQIDNNVYMVKVIPSPFSGQISKFKDNVKCVAADPNSGELRARIFVGTTEIFDFSPYTFQWYTGLDTTNPIPAAQGGQSAIITNLVEGDYSLVITNTQKGCTSALVSANVALTITIPGITITPTDQTQCNPPNGKLEAFVTGGNTGYTFEWFNNATPLGITTSVANGLKGDNYTVVVSRNGCTVSTNQQVNDMAIEPDAAASVLQHVIDCANLQSGSITAEASIAGVVQPSAEYTFNWYYYNNVAGTRGSILPAANGTGATRTGLAVGFYQLEVTRISTQCVATQTPIVEILSSQVLPSASITEVIPQTSCDPNKPNGVLSATGVAGTYLSPADFTFEWFRGDNTLPENKIPIVGGPETISGTKGEIINNVKGGGLFYTVKVTTPLNCSTTAKYIISENVNIPVITLTQLTPNTVCDATKATAPYNGSVQATVTFGPLNTTVILPDPNYTFTWYDGTTTATLHAPAPGNLQNPILTGLKDGDYAAIVERTDLFCKSMPSTAPVLNTTVLPVLSSSSTGSVNCDPALTPDGTVTVSVTNVVAGDAFTYQWYAGNTVGVSPLGAANNGTLATAIKVGGPVGSPNPYTVEVLNTTTGCLNNTTQFVADISVVPVLSTSTLPNSICAPATNFNGSMTVGVTNIPAGYFIGDYTFTWYDGNTSVTPHPTQPTPSTIVTLPTLDAGTYSVIGKNTKTGCISSIATNQVANQKIFPVLTPSSTGSNNCDPALAPDGTVSVAPSVAVGPFSYQWYLGSGDPIAGGFTTVPTAVNNGQSQTAIGLGGPVGAPVSYTVLVTDQVTGCTNFTTTAVADNSIVPVLSTSTLPNSICAPATNFNGSMTVGVTNITAGHVIGDYTFTWYDGNTSITPHPTQPIPNTTVTLSTLQEGTYSVIGKNTKTGCVSLIATNQVANQKIFPVLAASSTGSNNCDPAIAPDGTVTVAPSVAAGPFNYQWYLGSGDPIAGGFTTVPTAVNNGKSQTAIGLGGPVGAPVAYTVLVTDQVTGCTNFTTTAVADNSIVPVLSTSTLPNSICAPATNFNGSMTVGVTNIPVLYTIADYTFTWYDGNTSVTPHPTQPIPNTTVTLSTLQEGTYSVIGKNTKTGCVSLIATNQVANQKIFPVLAASSTGSNNCDPAIAPDGTVTVAPSVAAGPFNYQWYLGSGDPIAGGFTTVPTAVNNGQSQTAIGLGGPVGAPVSYTVLVTDQVTGCTNFTTTAVADVSVIPVLAFTTINPNTICVPSGINQFDGEINVTVSNLGTYLLTDFVFTWKDATPAVISGYTSTKLDTRDVGSYTVEAKNTKTGCPSAPIIGQVPDGKVYPIIDITSTGSHNCITAPDIVPDGTATAAVTNAGGDSYTFAWSSVLPALAIDNATNNANLATAIKLGGPTNAPSSYKVVVTNNRTGCVNNNTGVVADLSQKPTFTLTPSPNHVCDITVGGPTNYDGLVTISGVTHPQLGTSNITYKWFDADPITGAITGNNINSTSTVLNQLDNGKYAATVTIDDLGCTSDPLVQEVQDVLTIPAIVTATTPNVNCVNPNGSAQVTTIDGGATTNYFINWYNGVTVAGLSISTNALLGNTLQGPAISYTVEAINKTTGCAGNTSVTVVDAIVTPTIAVSVTKNNTICDTPAIDPDGELLATVGSVNPGYSITWSGGAAPAIAAGANGETYTKLLAGGPYTAFVLDNITGCQSANDSENIIDNLTYPVITVTVTPQSTCSGTPNGELVVTPVLGDTYNWFDGIGIGTAHIPAGNTISQLIAGDYTVQATTTSTGCKTVQTKVVSDQIVYPTISFIGVTPVTSCITPNGSATASIAGLSPPTKYDIFYNFTSTLSGAAFPTDPAVLKASVDPANRTNVNSAPIAYGNLIPGYLTALVIDKNTLCESVPVTQQIIDNTVKSNITLTLFASPGICGTGFGGIDPAVGPLPAASYTYEWYFGTPTNVAPINFFNNAPTFSSGQIYADNGPNLGINHTPVDNSISPATYTLVVRDPDGCGTYKTDNVPTSTIPVIDIVPTDITRCDISNGALAVKVSSGTSVSGYSLEIFAGNDDTNPATSKGILGLSPINTTLPVANLAEGPYYVKLIDGDNPTCPLGANKVLVKKVLPPVITIAQILPNTSCDPLAVANGKVNLTANNASGDVEPKNYFVSNLTPAVTGLTPGFGTLDVGNGDSGQSTGLLDGFEPASSVPTYTFTIQDDFSKCSSNIVASIPDQQSIPSALNIALTPETACMPLSNGQALASLAGGESTGIFEFAWAQNNDLSSLVYKATGNGANTAGELLNQSHATASTPGNFWPMAATGLGSGNRTFYVQGMKNNPALPGFGCKTEIKQVVILDQHISPDMTLTPFFDSFCLATAANGQIGDGTITIAADADPVLAGQQNAAGGFDYAWTTPNAGLASPQLAQSNNFNIGQLGDGVYTITATNATNKCKVVNSTTIDPSPYVIAIEDQDLIDQRICNNDGLINIKQIKLTDNRVGGPNTKTDIEGPDNINALYSFKWYNNATLTGGTELKDAAATLIPVRTLSNDGDQNGTTAATVDYPAMKAGTYYVVATRTAAAVVGVGCPSLPYRVDVKDVHLNPAAQLTPFSNTSCLPGTDEGEIKIKVTDATAAPFAAGTYTYTWDGANPEVIAPTVANNGNELADGDGDYPKQLIDGTYKVTITNNKTGCTVLATSTIVKNATPVFVQNATVIDQVLCGPDGSITVQTVTLNDRTGATQTFNSGSTPNISDFDFLWQRSASAFTQTTVGPVGAATLNSGNYNAVGFGVPLGFDNYTVVAKRRAGSPGAGCLSGPYQVIMQDQRKFPVVSLTPFANTACSPTPIDFEGEIKVNVTDASVNPTIPFVTPFSYNYEWTVSATPGKISGIIAGTSDGDGDGTDGDNDHPKSLKEGTYTVSVTNTQTGCAATGSTTILKNTTPVFIQNVVVLDQILCGPDGSLTVSTVTLNDRSGTTQTFNSGSAPNISDFEFNWQRNASVFTQTTAGTTLNSANYVNAGGFNVPIGFDTYTVTAKRINGGPGAGCLSSPFKVDILDKRIFPVVTLTPFANTSCSSAPADLEGEIKVKVTDASVNPTVPFVTPFSYNYNWTASTTPGVINGGIAGTHDGDGFGGGENDGVGIDNDGDHPKLLAEGNYTVSVTNTQTGCAATGSTTIIKNSTPVFTQLVTPTDQVLCTADGKLIVNEVRLIDRNGTTKSSNTDFAIADFSFTYSRNILATTIPAVTGTQLNIGNYPTIGADTYYVVATRMANGPGLGCSSPPFKVDILDKRIFPVVTLTPFANTSCSSLPADLEGEIKVNVSDASVNLPAPLLGAPYLFNYNWTTSATPAVINGIIAGTNDGDGFGGGENDGVGIDNDGDHPKLLAEGNYTVSVTNTQTGCAATGSTTIIKNSTPVFTQLVTPTDQVLCTADGKLIVNEVRLIDRNGTTKSSNTDFAIGDFNFTYSRNTLANTIAGVTGTQLNIGNYPTIGADTYYVVATRMANGPGLGCSSPPFKVDIQNKQILPVVTLTPFANTSCSSTPADLEGEIEVNVTDASVNLPFIPTPFVYNYNWTVSATPAVISGAIAGTNDGDRDGTDGDGDHPKVLAEGDYTVSVTNTQTGCTSIGSTTILKNSTPVFTQLVTPTNQVLCLADGKLVVNEVRVIDRNGTIKSSTTDFPIGDFNFTYSRNILASTIPAVTGTQLNIGNYPSIGADTYFVVATRVTNGPGLGCSSPPFKVDIQNKQILPIVAITPFANTSCDPTFFEGEVKVKVTDASVNLPFIPTPFVYNYNWTISATPAAISGIIAGTNDGDETGTDGDGDNPKGLKDGDYTVAVTNTQTGCTSTGSTTIFRNSTPVFTQLVIPTDQVLCNPDGQLLVNEVKVIDRTGTVQSNLTGDFPISDFVFSYDRTTIGNTILSNSPSVLLNNVNYNTIGFDSYYVVATRMTGGPGRTCSSAPYKVDIRDKRLLPKLSYTTVANSSCSILKPNGEVNATALEQDNTIDTYTFGWKYNNVLLPIASPAAGSTIIQTAAGNIGSLTDSPDGNYILTVHNTLTGCDFTSDVNVTVDRDISLPNIINVNKFEPTTCIGDGSAEVTSISIGGGPALSGAAIAPPNFEYEWYNGSFVPTSILGTVTPLLTPIAKGKYYVLVKDLTTDCKSAPTEVELLDINIVYPVVEITLTTPQISCDDSFGTGVLLSTADSQNDTNPNYTFTWYPSVDLSGTSFASTSTISDLKEGNYSLQVKNLTTGCTKDALYIIPDDAPHYFPQLALSSSERTLCVGQDGVVFAGIININPAYPFPLNFTADFFLGDKASDPNLPTLTPDIPNLPNVPSFPQNFVGPNTLAEGIYTVRVVDNNTGCVTAKSEQVIDGRVHPVVDIVPENPNINCDDTIANGQLAATADGNQVAGYIFDWYNGATIATNATPIVTGNNRLIGQVAGDYSVRVTTQLTGCDTDKSGKIADGRVYPAAPTASVIRDRTNCLIPNGWVAANVNGVTIAHTFSWYDGSTVKTSPDFTGPDYFDREIGAYSVTATDIITQCVSKPATVNVKDGRIMPDVSLTTTPAFCLTPTGVVTLELLNNQEVILTDISWYDNLTNGNIGHGPEVYNLPAGFYTAEFITSESCEGSASTEVKTEILSYNLVSVNGDNKNDAWIVDCLQNFPNNNVKVFNRSGIKVYEADGYNNTNVIFKGVGENGVYFLGDKLPDGTYFYIIDKRDGSRPVTGYLELVR